MLEAFENAGSLPPAGQGRDRRVLYFYQTSPSSRYITSE